MKSSITSLRKSCTLLLFLLGSAVLCSAVSREEEPAIKTIRYDNLKLNGQLPYQETFKIKGNRNVFLTDKADAAILTITDKVTTKAQAYFWWKKETAEGQEEDSDFEFLIDQGLQFNREYTLNFQFFQLTTNAQALKDKLKERLLPALNALYTRSGGLILSDLENTLKGVLQNTITATSGTAQAVGKLVVKNGRVEFTEISSPVMDAVDAGNILQLVNLKKNLVAKETLLKDKKGEKDAINLPALKAWMGTFQQGGATYFNQSDIDAVDAFVTKFALLSDELQAKIKAANGPAGSSQFADLKKTVSIQKGFLQLENTIRLLQEEIEKLTPNFDTTIDALILDNIFSALGSGMTIASKTESAIKSDDIVGTRFTAVVGAGVVGLNLHLGGRHGPVAYRPFAYAAVKYYFRNVDKRVANPYLDENKNFKKWSLIGGWKISGDLQYQGRELQQVISINPVIGLSVDLSRYISIDFLGMFYNQSALNPFDKNTKLGLAPCLSLSADFDLINRLQDLFTNKPYTVQNPNDD